MVVGVVMLALRPVRRDDRHDLGADRQGGPAARRRDCCSRCSCWREFGFNPLALFGAAADQYGAAVLAPGKLVSNPLDAISLGLALMFGTAGLPHILMRFYTVPDARPRARRCSTPPASSASSTCSRSCSASGRWCSSAGRDPRDRQGRQHGRAAARRGASAARRSSASSPRSPSPPSSPSSRGSRSPARPRSRTTSGSTWSSAARRREHEQLASRALATVVLGALAIALGIVFKGQNVAFMVGLAFAIAASANFPALLLSMFWRRFTTRGRRREHARGHGLGAAADRPVADDPGRHPGNAAALFPLKNPALISMPLSFAVGILVSLLRPEPAARRSSPRRSAGCTSARPRLLRARGPQQCPPGPADAIGRECLPMPIGRASTFEEATRWLRPTRGRRSRRCSWRSGAAAAPRVRRAGERAARHLRARLRGVRRSCVPTRCGSPGPPPAR